MRSPAELAVTIPRRWAWALGVSVTMLVGLLVWLVLAARDAVPPVAETARSAVAAAQRRIMGPVPLRAEMVTPQTVASVAIHDIDEYEVCGGTWVKVNADGEPDGTDMKRAIRRDDVIAAVDRTLAVDARPQAQAARLWLQMLGGGSAAATRDSLARLAVASIDPVTYALAFHGCSGGRVRDGACALLSAEQWARLDPGNAAPWQAVFAAAQTRKDNAAANEALHRIATSKRSDQRTFDLLRLVLDAAPNDDALQNGVFALAVEVIGIQAAWSLPSYQPLVSACKTELLRDSNRRQTCEAMGELFAQRSDTLLERGIGVSVGRQLGWPEERIDRMRAEQAAYGNSMFDSTEPREAMGCTAIRRLNERFRRGARLGEVGAMHEWIAKEALSAEELLRRYRAEQRALAERANADAVARAASSASAPG